MKIKLTFISNDIAIEFLKKNKANKEQVCISDSAFWIGAYDDDLLVGCVGLIEIKSVTRIKSLYVHRDFRKRNIGGKLLKYATSQKEAKYTAFATKFSINLFKKNGFTVQNLTKKREIYFLKRGL